MFLPLRALRNELDSPNTNRKTPALAKIATPTTTPTPMPALAPVDKELDEPPSFDASGEVGPDCAASTACPPCEVGVAESGSDWLEGDVREEIAED